MPPVYPAPTPEEIADQLKRGMALQRAIHEAGAPNRAIRGEHLRTIMGRPTRRPARFP